MTKTHIIPHTRVVTLATFLQVALATGGLAQAAVDLTVENVDAVTGAEVEVPVSVRGATGLEGIQFVLMFDPASLEFLDATPATLAGTADINLKERAPGTVRIAMLPEATVGSGEGTLLLARFRVLAPQGKDLPISLSEAKASEFKDEFPVWMQVTTTPGVVRTVEASSLPTWLWIAIPVSVILLLVLLRLLRRKTASS